VSRIITYHLRVVSRLKTYDVKQPAESLPEARKRFEQDQGFLAPFDWRGAVCFTEGIRPFEERQAGASSTSKYSKYSEYVVR